MNIVRKHLGVNPNLTLNSGPRGSVSVYPEGYLINLFQGADLSTLLHETGHIFFEEMERLVFAGAADETMRRDYETMRTWLGAAPGEALGREQREQAARGFEAYLMEGKAPSRELEGAFTRFRKWLLHIYDEARHALGVKLTDEVRGVFDRMLSTEREIAATAARNELLDLTARELDALGLTGTARTTAAGLMGKARDAAAESLQRARDENRKDRLAKYAREAKEELRQLPEYRARADMRATPLDLPAARDAYGDEAADALRKKIPGGLRNEDGVDPEIFAAEHGFKSGADMVARLLDAPPLGEAVKQRIQEKEARRDAEYEALEYLLDTREVGVQWEIVGRRMADILGVPHIEREAYIRAAERELAAMPMSRAIQAGNFQAAMRRELGKWRRALGAGDLRAALEAQRKAMLNLEFARLSRETRERQGVVERKAKRFIGMAKGDPDARFIVMDLASKYGLAPRDARLADGRGPDTLDKWTRKAVGEGFSPFISNRITQGAVNPVSQRDWRRYGVETPGTWRDMSVEDFGVLDDTINQIVTVERAMRQVEIAGRKAELDAVGREIRDRLLSANQEKKPGHIKEDKEFFGQDLSKYSLTKTEILFMKLDGKEDGPLWQVYKRASDAEDQRALRLKAENSNLGKLYGLFSEKERARLMKEKMIVKALGNEVITRENMLAVALNMGNEINHQRLLESTLPDGARFTQEAINEILGNMTEQDCAFVNAAWEYLESFREESFALEERINGLRPEAVEARPFALTLKNGKAVQMRGGYYPIAYDPRKGSRAQSLNEQDIKEDLFGSGFGGSAQTKQNHLQKRAEYGLGTPLVYKLSVIDDHVYNVVNDLTMREATMDAARILRHRDVKNAIERVAGVKTYKTLIPWLRDVVRERRFGGDGIDRAFHWMRNGLSVMAMGFKAGTMLLQATGLSVSVSRLGLKYMARGMRAVYGNSIHANPFTAARRLMGVYAEVAAKSPFMATRLRAWSREVKDASKAVTRGRGALHWTREHAFDLIGLAQMGVDLPTWMGAYEQGLERWRGNEAKAVAHADRTVRLTQGSGKTSDLSAIQRGGELQKAVTTFYSWFNVMFNLASLGASETARAETKGKAVSRAAGFLFWAWFGTQAMEIILDALRDTGPDDDDDEKEWAKYLAGKFAGFWAGMIPLGRDIFNAKLHGWNLEFVKGSRGVVEIVNLPGKVIDLLAGDGEEAGKKAAVGAVRSLGYALHIPTEPAAQALKMVWDYMDGTTPELEIRKMILR
ncbi:MAG: hypothetical protein LBO77_01570 [Desulfovibrio sp.]|nr:hypothetical protein [Desulfovibrio sp.]